MITYDGVIARGLRKSVIYTRHRTSPVNCRSSTDSSIVGCKDTVNDTVLAINVHV